MLDGKNSIQPAPGQGWDTDNSSSPSGICYSRMLLLASLLLAANRVVVFNLGDRRKGYFDDLAVRALYFHAGRGECLSGLHAPDNASHALAINRHYLDIVLAVKRLKGRKCFCDFHDYLFSEVSTPLGPKPC